MPENSGASSILTKEQEIETVSDGFRHLAILGSGASRATALHSPMRSGLVLPLMTDIVSIVGLQDEIKQLPASLQKENFEKIYSTIHSDEKMRDIRDRLERKVYQYFDSLRLPPTPTLYDYLVLSLRSKDMIASFNWDPLLIHAYARNMRFTKNLPEMVFLHGNVAIGLSEADKRFGPKGQRSEPSGNIFEPIPILFPVTKKNYTDNLFIREQWEKLSYFIETDLAMVTIFGYSAPSTDVDAMSIIKKAWGEANEHPFTQFEFIDVRKGEDIIKSWNPLIHNAHHTMHDNFFSSTIGQSPRRTGEVFNEMYMKGMWPDFNAIPHEEITSLEKLWKWYEPLIRAEQKK